MANKQPDPAETERLLQLYQTGQFRRTEEMARALLHRHPHFLLYQNLLGLALEEQGKLEDAAQIYRQSIKTEPKIAELHFNLGSVLSRMHHTTEAITSYQQAVSLKPGLAVAHFNLGIMFQQQGESDLALESYRHAIAAEPGFVEAYGNLGMLLQVQGKPAEAIRYYQQALKIQPDALTHFNLGTALRDQGQLDTALEHYQHALALQPDYADALNNMGEILRDQGNMDQAITAYQQAIAINPQHPQANYNMAEFLYLAEEFDQAIPYFEASRLLDWQDRVLYCLYKQEKYQEFSEYLQPLLASEHVSPLLATLSTHYATNFRQPDPYRFCPDPLKLIYHAKIPELLDTRDTLLDDLLREITFTDIAPRKQGRLYHGIQSAGNLLKITSGPFARLAALIKDQVRSYQRQFAHEDCQLIRSFPRTIEFSSSWFLRMQQGGHLTSHIHEEGWLSGCVYLSLPTRAAGQQDGCIEFSTDGDNYPHRHDDFPRQLIQQQVGDIVIFPSSLFHRTIPFHSNESRICIAFDIKPEVTR